MRFIIAAFAGLTALISSLYLAVILWGMFEFGERHDTGFAFAAVMLMLSLIVLVLATWRQPPAESPAAPTTAPTVRGWMIRYEDGSRKFELDQGVHSPWLKGKMIRRSDGTEAFEVNIPNHLESKDVIPVEIEVLVEPVRQTPPKPKNDSAPVVIILGGVVAVIVFSIVMASPPEPPTPTSAVSAVAQAIAPEPSRPTTPVLRSIMVPGRLHGAGSELLWIAPGNTPRVGLVRPNQDGVPAVDADITAHSAVDAMPCRLMAGRDALQFFIVPRKTIQIKIETADGWELELLHADGVNAYEDRGMRRVLQRHLAE